MPLFDGERGETHAHFTFAARTFRATNLQNGTFTLGLDPVGEFSLYLQRIPASTFDDPSSFAKGDCIATFRRTSLVVGTTVGLSAGMRKFLTPSPGYYSRPTTTETAGNFNLAASRGWDGRQRWGSGVGGCRAVQWFGQAMAILMCIGAA